MHTTEVSGSTIRYEENCLPIKNIPVAKMSEDDEKNLKTFSKKLEAKIEIFTSTDAYDCVAVAISGMHHTAFKDIQELRRAISDGLESYCKFDFPVVVICENDIGKVLGNTLKIMLGSDRKIICIDNIFVKDGDFVDIGEPVVNGRVVPVVTKTLIFNR